MTGRMALRTTSCVFDIVVMLSPALLMLDNGVVKFLILFYGIYLPYLMFSCYKRYRTRNEKKGMEKKHHERRHQIEELIMH